MCYSFGKERGHVSRHCWRMGHHSNLLHSVDVGDHHWRSRRHCVANSSTIKKMNFSLTFHQPKMSLPQAMATVTRAFAYYTFCRTDSSRIDNLHNRGNTSHRDGSYLWMKASPGWTLQDSSSLYCLLILRFQQPAFSFLRAGTFKILEKVKHR